jgi:5'-nucleotidase
MRILVSNDDGVYSPGLACLAEVASEFGSVCVVAPDAERSSTGHAITASRPLSYRRTVIGDLQLGAHQWGKVDLVLSGLNIGLNLGNGIWHSGTLAAAKQAALLGLRGIALSAPAGVEPHFDPYKPWIRRVLDTLLADPSMSLVNVNFPRNPKGMMWTRVSVRQYDGRVVPTTDPLGRELYWFTVTPIAGTEEGTDRWSIEQGWISLTPLRLDLTDEAQLADVRKRRPLDEALAVAVSPLTSSPDAAAAVREDEAAVPVVNHPRADSPHEPR